MKLSQLSFKRRFSVNPYNTLRLPVGEMSLYKDFVNDKRGDPYPVLLKEGNISEKIKDLKYCVSSESGGRTARFFAAFFPIYTYEFKVCELHSAKVGFLVNFGGEEIKISFSEDHTVSVICCGEKAESECDFSIGDTLAASFRPGGISIYVSGIFGQRLICDFSFDKMNELLKYDVFMGATVSVYSDISSDGYAELSDISAYLYGGLSHADMKPMRYENGEVIVKDGRVFLTMTSRIVKGSYQSVVSWNPTLCDFRLEGAMLFDVGDGICAGDVASSVIYDRGEDKWYI